jgi:hypothetical protein
LGKFPAGAHSAVISVKDDAGNTANQTISLLVEEIQQAVEQPSGQPLEQPSEEQPAEQPSGGQAQQPTTSTVFQNFLPSVVDNIKQELAPIFNFLEPTAPSQMVTVPKEAPPVLKAKWKLFKITIKNP